MCPYSKCNWNQRELQNIRWSGLDFFLIDILPVTDSKNENLISQNSVDYPVLPNAILTETRKLSLKDWIGLSVLWKFFLNFIKNAFRFCPGQLFQVTLY